MIQVSEIPYERQAAGKMCGAAALHMVYASLGTPVPQWELWPSVTGGHECARTRLLCADALARGLSSVILEARDPWQTLQSCQSQQARVVLNQYRRRVHRLLWSIVVPQFLRPLWRTWFELALLTAPSLPVPRGDDAAGRVTFAPHAHAYVHPVQDVASYRAAIRAGLTSRAQAVAETGEDVELVDAQIAADNQRAARLGLALDSDGRQTRGGES